MILHPVVDLLGHGCRFAEVYRFHVSPEVLPHQVQELRVEGDTFLQEEAVGKSDHAVGVVVRHGRGQVLEQRELHTWRAEGGTVILQVCRQSTVLWEISIQCFLLNSCTAIKKSFTISSYHSQIFDEHFTSHVKIL